MATFTSIFNLRKPATTELVNVATDLNENFDKLDAHGHIGTTVALTGDQSVAGVKTFRDGFKSRTVAGDTGSGGITMKVPGDLASGVIDWVHNGDYGYLVHLVSGPDLVQPWACLGIGNDLGSGVGLLVSNKGAGKGIVLNQNATVSAVNANAFAGTQSSDVASFMWMQQAVADAKPLIDLWSLATATAGQKMQVWSGITNGEFGYVEALSGVLAWAKAVEVGGTLTMLTNGAAIRGKNVAGTAFETFKVSTADAVVVGDVNNTGGTIPLQLCAGGVSSIIFKSGGTERGRVDVNGWTVAASLPLNTGVGGSIRMENATSVWGKTNAAAAFEMLKCSSGNVISVGDVNNSVTANLELCAGGVTSVVIKTGGTERLRVDTNGVTVADGKPLIFGTTTGTKIGNATTQKLAFYGATPVVRPTGVAVDAAGIHAALVTLGLIAA